MNDKENGRVEGLLIAMLVCERYKRNPKKLPGALADIVRKAGIEVARNAIDRIAFEASFWEKHPGTRLPSD